MRRAVQKFTKAFHYGSRNITYRFWANSTDITTAIFLGTAQTGKAPKWVAELAQPGTVVVEGLPHWKAHPSGSDLKEFTHAYTKAAYLELLTTFQKPALHVIGISQAAPGVVWLAQGMPTKINNLGLVVPLGLTMQAFGNAPKQRLDELKRRVYETLAHTNIWRSLSIRELYVSLRLLRARFSESKRGASDNKYAAGLSYDLREDCREVAKHQLKKGDTLTVFVGQNDTIFPPQEVIAAIEGAHLKNIDAVTLNGLSHSSFVSPQDKKALNKIISIVSKHKNTR